MPPPSLLTERAKVAEFYSAGSGTIPPLPWLTFPPPLSSGDLDALAATEKVVVRDDDLGPLDVAEHGAIKVVMGILKTSHGDRLDGAPRT